MSSVVRLSESQTSYSHDAVLVTSYKDDYITRGNGFLFERNISIANGATALILFDYRTYHPALGQLGQIYIYPPFFQTTAGPVTVNLYRDTNYSGGTPYAIVNPNTLAKKKVSGTTISLAPTGTVKGDLAMVYLVGGGTGGVGNASPGATEGISYFIRDNSKVSLVEIVNGAGADITFHYGQMIFEI